MKKGKIGLIGARSDGHASVVVDALRILGSDNDLFFFDDTESLRGTFVLGIEVLGPIDSIFYDDSHQIDFFHICVGDNQFRSALAPRLTEGNKSLITVVHPTAWISPNAKLSDGVYVGPMVSLNSGVEIGSASIINTGVIVDHDCKIGAATHLAPRSCLTGRVKIGDRSFLGAGTVVVPDITIGSDVFICAGSIVTSHIPSNTKVKK